MELESLYRHRAGASWVGKLEQLSSSLEMVSSVSSEVGGLQKMEDVRISASGPKSVNGTHLFVGLQIGLCSFNNEK